MSSPATIHTPLGRTGDARFAGTSWVAAFAIALAIYVATMHRGPQWTDSGWQQYRIISGQIEHPYGLALIHPVQFYVGRAALMIGAVSPPTAVTLSSVVPGAIAIANIIALIALTTRDRVAALIAGGSLMLAHTFWMHATHVEAYAITTAILTGEWILLAAYFRSNRAAWLLAAFLLNGLGFSNHVLALLSGVVIGGTLIYAIARRRIPWPTLVGAVIAWTLGAAPYLVLIVLGAMERGSAWAAIHSALFGERYVGRVLNASLSPKLLLLSFAFAIYNFPNLTLPLAAHALARRTMIIPGIRWCLIASLILYGLFAIRYDVVDQYSFFFAAYAAVAALGGIGLADIRGNWSPSAARWLTVVAAVTVLLNPIVYLSAWRVFSANRWLSGMVGNKPYRDGYRTLFVPWGAGDDFTNVTAARALTLAGPDGLIITNDVMAQFAIRIMKELGQAPDTLDLAVLDTDEDRASLAATVVRHVIGGRPIVLIPLDRDRPDVEARGRWERQGDLYLLQYEPVASGPTSQPNQEN